MAKPCACGCGKLAKVKDYAKGHNPLCRTKRAFPEGEPWFLYYKDSRPKYRIDPVTGCWVWIAATSPNGYGNVPIARGKRQKARSAHTAHWEFRKGKVPDGFVLDHLCRNRSCINIDHLEIVTPAENTRRGVLTRLTEHEVREIRTLYKSGNFLQSELAEKYGICGAYVSQICSYYRWRDVIV